MMKEGRKEGWMDGYIWFKEVCNWPVVEACLELYEDGES